MYAGYDAVTEGHTMGLLDQQFLTGVLYPRVLEAFKD